jgi:transposase, IS30 family
MTHGHYKHLSQEERFTLCRLRAQKTPIHQCAKILERSPSTLYRELKRNMHHNGDHPYYTYSKANEKAMARRKISKPRSKHTVQTWAIIEQKIRLNWSPEQVANWILGEHGVSISTETIYQYIYNDRKAGGNLIAHLRHRFRKRRKRYRSKDYRGVLRGKRMIGERPQEINNRESIGHWEIDTVLGKGSKRCIATLVERKTGYLIIGLLDARNVDCLNAKVIELIRRHNMPFLSITADNGTEFHGYKAIEQATQTTFYFATPHHSWERGTNENTNGLIRQYLPKGTSMKRITQNMCDLIAKEINERPRKRLGYRMPSDRIREVA